MTTPSTVDVGLVASTAGRREVQALIEDGGAPAGGSLLFDGSLQGWRRLSAVDLDPDDSFLAYLLRAPALLLARVRGHCQGYATALVGRMDLVFRVDPDVEESPFCGSEHDVAQRLTQVRAATAAWPSAATLAASLLRGQARQDPATGLLAESTAYSLLQSGPEFRRWLASRTSA